jgi:signal transduction histidine kinase
VGLTFGSTAGGRAGGSVGTVERVLRWLGGRPTGWRLVRDVALWAVLAALVLAEGVLARSDPWWALGPAVVALAVAVLLRRDRPLAALAITGTINAICLTVSMGTTGGVPVAYIPPLVLMSYLAGRRAERARPFVLLVCVVLIGILVAGTMTRRDVPLSGRVLTWFMLALLALLFVVLPWFTGRYRSQRDQLASAGWERAERIEREQRMVVDQARLRERSRIAEDMHDSVGHELSLIAIRAAALEVDPELSARHRAAAGELRTAAALATERLGEIIGVLRGSREASVTPASESVADLVERAAASGLDVRLDQHGPAGEVAPLVDRAAHRVVQEALTNAAKYAPGAAVEVRLEHRDDEVLVRVRNGPPGREAGTPVSGGRGLAGLAERVRLAGGRLTSGTTAAGGFEVAATMPREGGAAPEPVPADSSAHERATVRRTARRGLVTGVLATVGVAAGLGGLALGYYLFAGYNSVLRPADYDAVRVGQTRSEVEPRLPLMQMVDAPVEKPVPVPPGARCEFYRSAGPFSITHAYRLCFRDDRLVSKDVVQTGTVQPSTTPSDGTP